MTAYRLALYKLDGERPPELISQIQAADGERPFGNPTDGRKINR
jgi:hypothetical protein